MKKIVQVWFNN